MSKMFTFAYAGKNEILDNLVASFSELVDMRSKKDFVKNDEYNKKNALFNEALIKYCCEESGREFEGVDMVKDPMVVGRTSFKEAFDTVIAQVLTPVMPKLTSEKYNNLYEVSQVGFGDNAKFIVESNELFIISEEAEGIARGGIQTLYNEEYTVKASKRTVTIGVDWYHIASGVQDWGSWGLRVAKSYDAYITAAVIKAMTGVIGTQQNMAKKGLGGYFANGINDQNWLTVSRNVSLANGGAPVYAMGTNIALAEVLPEATDGFRFGSADDYVVNGYLPHYKKVPLIEIDNALVPNTINNTPKTIVSDDYIYMIAMAGYRPVKVVFEGNTVSVHEDAAHTKDRTYSMTVDMWLGVDVIAGSKFGVILK